MSYAYALEPASRVRHVPPPFTVRIVGPAGAGKTSLVAALCRNLRQRFRVAAVAPRKDAVSLRREAVLDPSWIQTLEEGGLEACLDARPEVLFIERAAGDRGPMVPADVVVAVVPIAMTDEMKNDPAIASAHLVVVNKTDLATELGVASEALANDLRERRGQSPFFLVQCRAGLGLTPVLEWFSRAYSTQSTSVGGSVR